jgi:inner membrane protein
MNKMETLATNVWQKTKLLVKGLLIGGLVLLLLVPMYFVQNLIREREERQKEAFTEVSSKWAGPQNITGPILVLPYMETLSGGGAQTGRKKLAYILPDSLTITADVKPEKRYRGIYQVMLYSSVIRVNGVFNSIPLQQLEIDTANVLWNEAYICLELADAKGLREDITVKWNESILHLNPASASNAVMREGFASPVAVSPGQAFHFSSAISLDGSGQLLFTPVGRETTVKLASNWPDPSFTGSQLPDHHISDSGFTATWKSLSHTRSFPQAWKNDMQYSLQANAFGADLFIPVNGYQKTMRSVKYAILCILLTFAAFFIIETVNRKSVHPFQYALIGLALILFYTLLLSFSEYTGFNTAYIIASVATVSLIGWFVKGILQSSRLTSVLSVILVLLYGYIFTILQLQDYSLLLGSIGLFLTLAVIMHFSRKIQW